MSVCVCGGGGVRRPNNHFTVFSPFSPQLPCSVCCDYFTMCYDYFTGMEWVNMPKSAACVYVCICERMRAQAFVLTESSQRWTQWLTSSQVRVKESHTFPTYTFKYHKWPHPSQSLQFRGKDQGRVVFVSVSEWMMCHLWLFAMFHCKRV